MLQQPFYDHFLSFDENFDEGPFGGFADGKVFKNKGKPKNTLLGQKIFLPFGIPAGPVPNSKYVKAAFEKGFDVVVYKTQRSITFPCNPHPNVLFVTTNGDLTIEKAKMPLVGSLQTAQPNTEISITNSFGNPSRGPQFWVKDLNKALSYEGEGQLLIASVVGTIQKGFSQEDYFDDFARAAELAAQTKVKAIEVNLSCPNVATEGVLCYSPAADESISKKVRRKIGSKKLIVKLGYFSHSQQKLLEEVVERMLPYVDAISAINTIPAPVVDEDGNQALPGPNRLMSGICGASIKWAGIDMVQRLVEHRGKLNAKYEVIGVGGVMTPNDFIDYRNAGADAVQSATAAMWNPSLAQEIKKNNT